MESFESDGLFWLPGQDEDATAGRISFDAVKGVRLSLIGSFSDTGIRDDTGGEVDVSTIRGVAGKRLLMLINRRVIRRDLSRLILKGLL
ncbi:hypothetical protein [Streptomyces sp. NPDC056480]|uniref:ApeA N-terminal domain 1-containing protein n=1 Tax=Streptomyces sp. NPDC056480 TaxID=3345833 RepID=UPI0036BFB895